MNALDKAHHALAEAERAINSGDMPTAVDRALEANAWASVSAENEHNDQGAELVIGEVRKFFQMLFGG